jgi:hypothetical protein
MITVVIEYENQKTTRISQGQAADQLIFFSREFLVLPHFSRQAKEGMATIPSNLAVDSLQISS